MQIMIAVEDNPGDLRLIRDAVAGADPSLDVIAFDDGPQALDALCGPDAKFQPEDIAIILLDLRLKSSDGLDVLRQIRFTPKLSDVPVVVFTSSAGTMDQQRSALLGAAKFVPKPLNVDEYFRVIKSILAESAATP